jgi:hypothetical protein
MQMTQPIEDVITIIASRRMIAINDVEQILDMQNNSVKTIIDFLLKFDFIKVVQGRYLALSESCSPFFEEILS